MKFTTTFTGLDFFNIWDNSSVTEILELSSKYRFMEIGILFSLTRSGKENKYPSVSCIEQFIENCTRWESENHAPVKRALHLCGSAARKFLTLESIEDSIIIHKLVQNFDRIQININALDYSSIDLKPMILRQLGIFDKPIILQYNENNKQLIEWLDLEANQKIHLLKDASGGNGIYDSDFSIPSICKQSPIGFAGGLGPNNIADAFDKIYQSVMADNVEGSFDNKYFWIDMESNIREKNIFNIYKIKTVLDVIDSYIRSAPTDLEF